MFAINQQQQFLAHAQSYHNIDRVMRRKINKHVVEKKRRTRINASLEQMKDIVLRARQQDAADFDKMEKADILQMTVEHLTELQSNVTARSEETRKSTRTGYEECLREVMKFCAVVNLDKQLNNRLMDHLHRHMEVSGLSNSNNGISNSNSVFNSNEAARQQQRTPSPVRPDSAPTEKSLEKTPQPPRRPSSATPFATVNTRIATAQPRVAMIPPTQRAPARVEFMDTPTDKNNNNVWRPF